jgi:hypothetical protein
MEPIVRIMYSGRYRNIATEAGSVERKISEEFGVELHS